MSLNMTWSLTISQITVGECVTCPETYCSAAQVDHNFSLKLIVRVINLHMTRSQLVMAFVEGLLSNCSLAATVAHGANKASA